MPSGRRAASQPDVLGKRDSYSCLTFFRSSGLYSVCTSLRARPTRSCFSPLLLRPIEASSVCRSETRKLLTMFCNKDDKKFKVMFSFKFFFFFNLKEHSFLKINTFAIPAWCFIGKLAYITIHFFYIVFSC